jgi:hypothetical protein
MFPAPSRLVAERPTNAEGAKALADDTASARMAAEIFILRGNRSSIFSGMKLFGKKYRSGKVAVKKIDKSCVAVIQPEGSTLKVH